MPRRDFHAGGLFGRDVRNARSRNHGTHAEAIEIIFNPQLSFRTCWSSFPDNDPTTLNRQGNDRGLSYRSADFLHQPRAERVAKHH